MIIEARVTLVVYVVNESVVFSMVSLAMLQLLLMYLCNVTVLLFIYNDNDNQKLVVLY